MENENSRVALKIVFTLSFLLVIMDFLEIYYSFQYLKDSALQFDLLIYESCIKYHLLSQIVFTSFACFAGLSAFLMSFGLIVNYEFFSLKLLDIFLYSNYLAFGPFLFAFWILGTLNSGLILYDCDPNDTNIKNFNYSTLLSFIVCFLLSFFVTIIYAFLFAGRKLVLSITFKDGGWRFLGKLFWKEALKRNEERIRNQENFPENNLNENLIPQENNLQIENNNSQIRNNQVTQLIQDLTTDNQNRVIPRNNEEANLAPLESHELEEVKLRSFNSPDEEVAFRRNQAKILYDKGMQEREVIIVKNLNSMKKGNLNTKGRLDD